MNKMIVMDHPQQPNENVINETYEIKLNDRLRSLRKAHKKTMLSMAQIVGVSVSTYAGYETPENMKNHRIPSVSKIMKFANYYGVSVDYLIGNTDQKYKYDVVDIREMYEQKKPDLSNLHQVAFEEVLNVL
jgi:transcriptional regulator with XRE-family HTH domain